MSALVILAGAVVVGALLQGSVGLGLGLVTVPVATLADPSLMPGTLLWLSAILPLLMLTREWRSIDWHGLRWALAARLPATVLGAWIVSTISTRYLGLLVGVLVLLAVAATAMTIRIPMRRRTLVGAGVVSGISGTATSIGGPPLALIYQHERGPRVRATLAVYFVAGATMSLVALAVSGDLTRDQTVSAACLLPALAAGFVLSARARRLIDVGRVRGALLLVCAVSAVVLIVRSVVG